MLCCFHKVDKACEASGVVKCAGAEFSNKYVIQYIYVCFQKTETFSVSSAVSLFRINTSYIWIGIKSEESGSVHPWQ